MPNRIDSHSRPGPAQPPRSTTPCSKCAQKVQAAVGRLTLLPPPAAKPKSLATRVSTTPAGPTYKTV